ncbi:MAG: TolC family protein [Candidatus Xenobiia bacterium LiM19]
MGRSLSFLAAVLVLAIFLHAQSWADDAVPAPLGLKEVCRLALQRNPSLESARASTSMSDAALNRARGALLPSVTLKSSYFYVSKATYFGTTPVLQNDTLIHRAELLQPIFTGGQIQAAANAAKWSREASASQENVTKDQVLIYVTTAYYGVRLAREMIIVAEQSIRHLEAGMSDAGKLYDKGVVIKADVLRAQVALASAKEQLIRAQNAHANAMAALKAGTGLAQNESLDIMPPEVDDCPIDLESVGDRKRPEIAAAEFAVKSAESQLRAAYGAALPSVYTMLDYENQPVGAQFPRLSNTYGAGVIAKFTLFDGGQTKAAVDEARAQVAKAKADLASVSHSVELQRESARLDLSSARSRLETLTTQMASAEESFRVIETGYREGVNVLTDLLSAESMLTAARTSRLQALYDLRIAEVNMLQAKGHLESLWEEGERK